MRFFSMIPALAALATLAGVALADDCGNSEMTCGPHDPIHTKRDFLEHPTREEMTNAELLRRGLPLHSPVHRRGSPVRRTSPSGAPPPSTPNTGYIKVLDAGNNNKFLGYISSTASTPGYLNFQPQSTTGALIVSLSSGPGASANNVHITMTNSDTTGFTVFGLIEGRDNTSPDIAKGNFNYLYLGGIAAPGTPPGSTPTVKDNEHYAVGSKKTVESDLWKFDSSTGFLTAQWINTGGSSPATQIFSQSGALYAGGDADSFRSHYPAPITNIVLQFVKA